MNLLEFEKPLRELELNLDNLRATSSETNVDVSSEIEAIEQKIEAEFTQYPILIFPTESEKLGQQVNLAIETAYDERLEQQIHTLLQNLKTLSKYESPKRLFFMKRFIYTESGKLQRTQTIKAGFNALTFCNIDSQLHLNRSVPQDFFSFRKCQVKSSQLRITPKRVH